MIGCFARLRSPMVSAISRSKDSSVISNNCARISIEKRNSVKSHSGSTGLRGPTAAAISCS